MKLITRTIFFFFGSALFNLTVSAQQKPLAKIKISNTSSLARENEIAEVGFSALASKVKQTPFRIIEAISKKEVPYQLEYPGFNKPVNLLIGVDNLQPKQVLNLEIVAIKNNSPLVYI